MDELREHPQVAELIDTLDKNDMHKEKAEVDSLVDYIGGMEKTLTEMLKEMQEMRQEINLIHNNSLRVKCQNLVEKTEGKIKQGFVLLGKVKDNVIQSAKNALKAFKERGKEALRSAVKAMKIPETLDSIDRWLLLWVVLQLRRFIGLYFAECYQRDPLRLSRQNRRSKEI